VQCKDMSQVPTLQLLWQTALFLVKNCGSHADRQQTQDRQHEVKCLRNAEQNRASNLKALWAVHEKAATNHSTPRIHIVYHCWLDGHGNYKHILSDQLHLLSQSKICSTDWCTLHVEVVCADTEKFKRAATVVNFFFHKAIVSQHCQNHYEFAGLHKVWQLAQFDKESIILYFHDKGVTHGSQLNDDVRTLMHLVVGQWKQILLVFEQHRAITKFGVAFAHNGLEWWNFWWARASYVQLLEEPIITLRRHYYEGWLGTTLFPNRIDGSAGLAGPMSGGGPAMQFLATCSGILMECAGVGQRWMFSPDPCALCNFTAAAARCCLRWRNISDPKAVPWLHSPSKRYVVS
jgi:hypothetical protein